MYWLIGLGIFWFMGALATFGRIGAMNYQTIEEGLHRLDRFPRHWFLERDDRSYWMNLKVQVITIGLFLLLSWVVFAVFVHAKVKEKEIYWFKWSWAPLQKMYADHPGELDNGVAERIDRRVNPAKYLIKKTEEHYNNEGFQGDTIEW